MLAVDKKHYRKFRQKIREGR